MYSVEGQTSKDELVNRHAPLVKKIAYHLMARLPSSVMVEDLIQAGMLGLLDAAGMYDQNQGASFETYASIRIRGAMLDELRRTDWAPKSLHRKSRDLSAAIHQVEASTGRDARDQEVAEVMGISLDEYHQIVRDSASSHMASFDEITAEESGGYDRFSNDTPSPVEQLQEEQFRHHLVDAIGNLPEREQLIMSLYYEEELNLKEIGAVLNVSESRISQLLSQAHARLRSRLQAHL